MTQEEVLERARQLVAEGYTLLPADDPEHGMRGFLAFLEGSDDELLEWPLFQGPLKTDKEEVQPEELVQFLATGYGPLDVCDDPHQLLVGFVRYEPEEGRAVVRQTRLRLLKAADDSTRAAITGVRDRLLVLPPIALNP